MHTLSTDSSSYDSSMSDSNYEDMIMLYIVIVVYTTRTKVTAIKQNNTP